MVDHLFADPELAALYDVFNPGRDDFEFYRPRVMAARAVLDVGCGTGAMLHEARARGHSGRLCGLDPAAGMLEQARRRTDVEWVLGDLTSVDWHEAFALVVMTGHAFQVFVEDAELCGALAAVRKALTPDGRFAFETRNPAARAWEDWTFRRAREITTPAGQTVQVMREVETPVHGDRVSFTHTFTSPAWDAPRRSRSTLRFLDAEALARFLGEAGLEVEEQFGDWDRSPLSDGSPEIITIARRAVG